MSSSSMPSRNGCELSPQAEQIQEPLRNFASDSQLRNINTASAYSEESYDNMNQNPSPYFLYDMDGGQGPRWAQFLELDPRAYLSDYSPTGKTELEGSEFLGCNRPTDCPFAPFIPAPGTSRPSVAAPLCVEPLAPSHGYNIAYTRRQPSHGSAPLTTPTPRILGAIYITDKPGRRYRYQCHCGREYSRAQDLERHFKGEHNPNPTYYPCPMYGCSYRFFTRHDKMMDHVKKAHRYQVSASHAG